MLGVCVAPETSVDFKERRYLCDSVLAEQNTKLGSSQSLGITPWLGICQRHGYGAVTHKCLDMHQAHPNFQVIDG